MENFETNDQLEIAEQYLKYTNQNVFLTGRAGTGKTTFLHNLKQHSWKRIVIVAPTGVAAINARGVTIHSFFQLSFGPQIPQHIRESHGIKLQGEQTTKGFNKKKINIIKSLDLLVIDEISMVRADILDAIDEVLRRYKNPSLPFGGIQILMIGDLQQLAPVVKDDEWDMLKEYYSTAFFFSSYALRKATFVSIELKKIYRQSDETFIDLLNKVRNNKIDQSAVEILNSRYKPNFDPDEKAGYITLSTHNFQAQQINDQKLVKIKKMIHTFEADVIGTFPQYSYPTNQTLQLKVGAQVMFVKNDLSPEKAYYNGKIGKITDLTDDVITVQCPKDSEAIDVSLETWENTRYAINEETDEIEEEVIGSFKQFPLKLAWAITIHKSQGLTFERAIIDAKQSFAHGQVYVALSRCKTLEGMVLCSRISPSSVINDHTVKSFTKYVEENQPTQDDLKQSRLDYERSLLDELFNFSDIQRLIQKSVDLYLQHKNAFVGNMDQTLIPMAQPIQDELVKVSHNFSNQINRLCLTLQTIEENDPLHERIIQASVYFVEKFRNIIGRPLQELSFDSDNENILQSMIENVQKIAELSKIKLACLEDCTKGFRIERYLEVKAKAAIDKQKPEQKDANKKLKIKTNNPDLYNKLVMWRIKEARKLEGGLSAVISHRSIIDIANNLPISSNELKNIHGMGTAKLNKFGKQILTIIKAYQKTQGMDLQFSDHQDEKLENAKSTTDTSLELFLKGHTIKEVAKQRNLPDGTIVGHLISSMESGKVTIVQLIGKRKHKLISQKMAEKKNFSLQDIRQELPKNITFNEVKIARAWYSSQNNR